MYIGIEIGGTKLQLGAGLGDGVLRRLWRETVDVKAGPEGIRRQITRGIPQLLAQAGIERSAVRGIGIGFGGPVDDATHTVIKSHQIEGWDDFPLARWISDLSGFPAVLGNDSDVAGLAEALFGAGKGLSPIFYMNIGSGIGGALIINGHIYRGCGRGAAEIGHLRESLGRSPTQQLTLEDLASGWAIQRRVRDELNDGKNPRTSLLVDFSQGQVHCITSEQVAQAYLQGDGLAVSVIDYARSFIAGAICQVIALLCPRRIIIGGGVAQMGEQILFRPLRQEVAERVFKPFAGWYEIVPAALGEEVVVHGALALARKQGTS
jgi:glucokinase